MSTNWQMKLSGDLVALILILGDIFWVRHVTQQTVLGGNVVMSDWDVF